MACQSTGAADVSAALATFVFEFQFLARVASYAHSPFPWRAPMTRPNILQEPTLPPTPDVGYLQVTNSVVAEETLICPQAQRVAYMRLKDATLPASGLSHFRYYQYLVWLILKATRILTPEGPPRRVQDSDLDHLQGLQRLQGLDLSWSGVTGEGLKKLRGMQLGFLTLSYVRVGDDDLSSLYKMPLQYLRLEGTSTGVSGLYQLLRARPLLTYVDVTNTRVTELQAKDLQTEMHNRKLVIHHGGHTKK
jgi:hypothetical protein